MERILSEAAGALITRARALATGARTGADGLHDLLELLVVAPNGLMDVLVDGDEGGLRHLGDHVDPRADVRHSGRHGTLDAAVDEALEVLLELRVDLRLHLARHIRLHGLHGLGEPGPLEGLELDLRLPLQIRQRLGHEAVLDVLGALVHGLGQHLERVLVHGHLLPGLREPRHEEGLDVHEVAAVPREIRLDLLELVVDDLHAALVLDPDLVLPAERPRGLLQQDVVLRA